MNDQLAQRLVKARSAMAWSQQQLSEVSGVAAAQISRYEAGRSSPRAEVVAKLAKALSVQFEWLAYGEGAIETGLDIPQYPKGVEVIPLEFDERGLKLLDLYAEKRGLTREMALKSLFAENLGELEEQVAVLKRDESKAEPASREDEMQKLQDMDARLARLEAQQKSQKR